MKGCHDVGIPLFLYSYLVINKMPVDCEKNPSIYININPFFSISLWGKRVEVKQQNQPHFDQFLSFQKLSNLYNYREVFLLKAITSSRSTKRNGPGNTAA